MRRNGAWWTADFRPWGHGRKTLRDPSAPNWPSGGTRTKSHREALEWALAYVHHFEEAARRKRAGLPPAHRRLEDATKDFLRHREGTVAPNTLGSDRTAMVHLVDFFGARATLEILSAPQVQRLLDRCLSEGYGPGTLHTYCRSINRFVQWLGLPSLWDGPQGLHLPDPGHEDARTWEPEELARIRDAADWLDERREEGPSYRLAVELALNTGGRQSELFALQWPDFKPAERWVRFERQLARGGGRFVPLKGKEPRWAVVLPDWWSVYERHRQGLGLVLAGRDGAPYPHRSQRRLIERVLDAARLNATGLAWHVFRHTYARRFIEGGARLEELRTSLGHSTIRTTEETYGHLREDVAARSAVSSLYRGQGLRAI